MPNFPPKRYAMQVCCCCYCCFLSFRTVETEKAFSCFCLRRVTLRSLLQRLAIRGLLVGREPLSDGEHVVYNDGVYALLYLALLTVSIRSHPKRKKEYYLTWTIMGLLFSVP